jgi:hypothetical protein
VRAVADQVAAAVDAVDAHFVDARQRRVQRREVCVDVGDDRYAFHAVTTLARARLVDVDRL